ncbi:MAG: recombinase RecA [Candidatus Absconditabacteria bacterium]|nr:recombinase RecA [Candidatus Absconditabacteria bacterium]MDD3868068.1 recombinase RecA [Candidatus Absconditabacteria bacterium]MDD4714315.1 recombinase RecA [Candidatus Absconditabacteria bacterium]
MTTKNPQGLKDALASIEKQFGKGAVIRMGDTSNVSLVNTFHSGSYILDLILGGGYPEGRVVEIYGPESSGKTTVALHAIAEIQKRGEIAAFIDAEHALDPHYARKLGVNIDDLFLSQPDYGEQALQIAEELAKSGNVKLIVIDSVAALVPKAEVEGDMGDSYMGLQARMMSQGLRKLASILAKTGTTCVFINQIRMKIGVMFGNPETTTGGNALKFFASQRIEIRRGDKIMEDKEQIGYFAKVKVAKNKIAAPFKTAEVPVKWGIGYDTVTDTIEAAVLLKLITKAGAFYTIGDQKLQGKEKLSQYLIAETKGLADLQKKIESNIKDMRSGKKVLDDEVFDNLEAIAEDIAGVEEVE